MPQRSGRFLDKGVALDEHTLISADEALGLAPAHVEGERPKSVKRSPKPTANSRTLIAGPGEGASIAHILRRRNHREEALEDDHEED